MATGMKELTLDTARINGNKWNFKLDPLEKEVKTMKDSLEAMSKDFTAISTEAGKIVSNKWCRGTHLVDEFTQIKKSTKKRANSCQTRKNNLQKKFDADCLTNVQTNFQKQLDELRAEIEKLKSKDNQLDETASTTAGNNAG